MGSTRFAIAFSVVLLACNVVAQTSTQVALKPITTMYCVKNPGNLTKMDEYDFASDGWCQGLCGGKNYPVMAMTGGSICYCGNVIPPLDQVVPKSNCNKPCAGYSNFTCGGFNYWQIYLTGLTNDVTIAPNGTVAGSSTSPSVTRVAETIVVTSSAGDSNSSTNKVGIAVGVVVGVVSLTGLIGAIIFYFKLRQRRAIEEEHRRLEAATAAHAAEKSDAASSRTDQRLDSTNIYSHRRESVGSIADEMDFSRRILQVRNPDRFSTNSPVPT